MCVPIGLCGVFFVSFSVVATGNSRIVQFVGCVVWGRISRGVEQIFRGGLIVSRRGVSRTHAEICSSDRAIQMRHLYTLYIS